MSTFHGVAVFSMQKITLRSTQKKQLVCSINDIYVGNGNILVLSSCQLAKMGCIIFDAKYRLCYCLIQLFVNKII